MTKDDRLNARELLIERLRKGRMVKPSERIRFVMDGVEQWASTGETWQHTNPDGIEAADAITELTDELDLAKARVAELEEEVKNPL